MKSLIYLFLATLLVHSALSCMTTEPPPDPTDEPTDAPTDEPTDEPTSPPDESCEALNDLEVLPETAYGEGGPVESPEELDFDAEKPEDACWKNHVPEEDELDFVLTPDASKLGDCPGFEGDAPPSGPALVHYSSDGSDGQALFHSCSLLCSAGPPKVTVTGSKSDDVTLEACRSPSFDEVDLQDCTPIEFDEPVEVGSEERPVIYDIVIVAKDFKENTYAAIKTIKVEAEPCEDPAGDNAVCAAACNFDDGSQCNYATDPDSVGDQEFKAYEQGIIVGNLDSGVNALSDSNPNAQPPVVAASPFLAGPQNPGDKLAASVEVDVQEDTEMTFKYYDACDGNAAKVCFDTIDNCPFTSNEAVSVADRQWQEGTVTVPAGTKKIILVGDDTGSRFCATGFDDIDFKKPGEAESLCPPAEAES